MCGTQFGNSRGISTAHITRKVNDALLGSYSNPLILNVPILSDCLEYQSYQFIITDDLVSQTYNTWHCSNSFY
jgi:hypothetical protein